MGEGLQEGFLVKTLLMVKSVWDKGEVVERNEKDFGKGNLRESRSVTRWSDPANRVVSCLL